MIMSDLYQRSLYLMDIDFLINSVIIEYDLSKANINILKYKKMISDELYTELYNADRMTRQVTIGNMMKYDQKIFNAIESGFVEARALFFDANNIEDKDVLSIKKDAIFLLRKANLTTFDNLVFNEKNLYTSFYNINPGPGNKKEIYYCRHPLTKQEYVDIKGIKDEVLYKHKEYFLEFLMVLMECMETDPEEAIYILDTFIDKYLKRELDVGYYRNFNSESCYSLLPTMSDQFSIRSEVLSDIDKMYVDISYNLSILRELKKIVSKNYFLTHKKPRC